MIVGFHANSQRSLQKPTINNCPEFSSSWNPECFRAGFKENLRKKTLSRFLGKVLSMNGNSYRKRSCTILADPVSKRMPESAIIRILIRFMLLAISVVLGVVVSGGCAPLKDQSPQSNRNGFSITRSSMNPGAVAVQLAVVQLDSDQREIFEQFWGHLDQMKVPLPVRKSADENGLRYAVMSSHVPNVLPKLLESRPLDVSKLSDIKRQMAEAGLLKSPSRMVSHQRIENDTGEEYEVTTSDVYPQKDWAVKSVDGVPLTGRGQLVKGVYRFTSFPQADGSVRLVMLPEIHHGVAKNRFDVSQRTFLLNESQIETKLTPLEFKVDLKPGESLIIAPNGTSEGIGDLLFGHQGLISNQSSTIDRQTELNRQIEAAVMDLDASLQVDLEVTDSATPVTPLFRFLMIRLLHAQSGSSFEADASERLTTVNHD